MQEVVCAVISYVAQQHAGTDAHCNLLHEQGCFSQNTCLDQTSHFATRMGANRIQARAPSSMRDDVKVGAQM